MLPEVYHVPFPDGLSRRHAAGVARRASSSCSRRTSNPARVAAIIIEPVQGEGGFYAAPPEFLRSLRALCDTHGIVLIADEIQTGFGRTGRMFAIEHSGVEPDLMTIAKSVAGGVPLSGVIGKAEIMDAPPPGGLGGTYAGSPLACAAALAVLDVMREEQLLKRATQIGALHELAPEGPAGAASPAIGEVRGLGAMVAMELVKNAARRCSPMPISPRLWCRRPAAHGLVHPVVRRVRNVIRFLAPLTISDALLKEGLGCLRAWRSPMSPARRWPATG